MANDPAGRRRAAAIAGHTGDLDTARRAWTDPDPTVRATAAGALARLSELTTDDVRAGLTDADPRVRRRVAELAAHEHRGDPTVDADVLAALDDGHPVVAEMAAWALGERFEPDPETGERHHPAPRPVLDGLAAAAERHDDALTREAAVAALGAIGDPTSLDVLLAATTDKPAVRRRAAIALVTHLDDPRAVAALRGLAADRDWQVRDAVDILLEGRDLTP